MWPIGRRWIAKKLGFCPIFARAIWTLLEEPITGAEIADTLSEVFPGADPDQIARDVAALLGAFETELLIQPDP